MREIKFRAWNSNIKTMRYDCVYWEDFGHYTNNLNNTLMQYTGLKDKNGKEVYEGDIVTCSSGCPHKIEWREELGGKFIGGMPGWYLSGLLSGGGEGYAWTGKEEIIGNIYETT